jgi:PKHD-type hydroxylase
MEDKKMEGKKMEEDRVTSFNWGRILTAEQLARVEEACESLTLENSTVGAYKAVPEDSVRVTKVAFFSKEKHKSIFELGRSVCTLANKRFHGFHIDSIGDAQLAVYDGEAGGHYNWHDDTDWANYSMYDRKITAVLMLSDPSEYTGGELEFKNGDVYTDLEKGSLITFPSYLRHKVNPVTSGVRVSLVFWAEGPRFR